MNQHVAVRSITGEMAERFGMEPGPFEATLRATVIPEKCTKEQFAAFLMVARDYSLNPITREIFAFPTRAGGIQPIVSVDGWMNIINSHPQMDGMQFDDIHNDKGDLTAIRCRIHRKDRAYPVEVVEYMSECIRNTDTWKTWPARMLRHKAAIQCARYAFGFSGIVEPDEFERMNDDGNVVRTNSTMVKPLREAPPAVKPAAIEHKPEVALETVHTMSGKVVVEVDPADTNRGKIVDREMPELPAGLDRRNGKKKAEPEPEKPKEKPSAQALDELIEGMNDAYGRCRESGNDLPLREWQQSQATVALKKLLDQADAGVYQDAIGKSWATLMDDPELPG